MQSWGRMRRMAGDVAEKHMDLSWIMNSSTTIDRRGKKRWIKDTLWRRSGEQRISHIGSSDEFVNMNLLCLQLWEMVPSRSFLYERLKSLLALQTKTWINHLSRQDYEVLDSSSLLMLTTSSWVPLGHLRNKLGFAVSSFGTAIRSFFFSHFWVILLH